MSIFYKFLIYMRNHSCSKRQNKPKKNHTKKTSKRSKSNKSNKENKEKETIKVNIDHNDIKVIKDNVLSYTENNKNIKIKSITIMNNTEYLLKNIQVRSTLKASICKFYIPGISIELKNTNNDLIISVSPEGTLLDCDSSKIKPNDYATLFIKYINESSASESDSITVIGELFDKKLHKYVSCNIFPINIAVEL